jgi:hypothetical protein
MLPVSVRKREEEQREASSGVRTLIFQYSMMCLMLGAVIFVVGLSRVPAPAPVRVVNDAALIRNTLRFAARVLHEDSTPPPRAPLRETNFTGAPAALARICESLPGGRPAWIGEPRYDPSAAIVLRVVYADDDDDDDGDDDDGDDDDGGDDHRVDRGGGDDDGDVFPSGGAPAAAAAAAAAPALARWLGEMHAALAPGAERYSLKDVERRTVVGETPGGSEYLLIYNPGRGTKKRRAATDTPQQVATPFDGSAFTFLRDAPQREVLFTFERASEARNRTMATKAAKVGKAGKAARAKALARAKAAAQAKAAPGAAPGAAAGSRLKRLKRQRRPVVFCDRIDPRDADAVVYLNVAPIDARHVILVPRPRERRTQVLTATALEAALRLRAALRSPRFPVGFNGYGAWASVNHGHLQGYELDPRLSRDGLLPAERAALAPPPRAVSVGFAATHPRVRVRALGGGRGGGTYPVPAIVYSVPARDPRLLRALARAAAECARYLAAANIAHNALVSLGGDADRGALVYLFPRRLGAHRADDHSMHPGYPELAGHVIAKEREFFDTATAAEIETMLAREALPQAQMDTVWRLCS